MAEMSAPRSPFDQFVVKVVSRCNLACPYCYEYFHGDDSWRRQPKLMSPDTMRVVARRIAEHAQMHNLQRVSVSLHGGEPLLAGVDGLSAYVSLLHEAVDSTAELSVGMQTNGVLYTPTVHRWAIEANISVGISLDGPPASNDRRRPYANGIGSTADVERALDILSGTTPFSGILSVIDIHADPAETLHYLGQWRPPILDFLLPHGNWQRRPPDSELQADCAPRYGRWLARAFDAWWASPVHSHIAVRTFEEIILRLAGRPGVLETMGTEPVTLVTIGTDGAYEGVDTLKSAFPQAQVLGLHTSSASLDQVLDHHAVCFRQNGVASLCKQCQECPFVRVCGGGYLPHRYGPDGTFAHPSVYCRDLAHLIQHVAHVLRRYSGQEAAWIQD